MAYRMQVSPLDCTGCGNCVQVCPAKEQGSGHEASGHSDRGRKELGVRHDRARSSRAIENVGHREEQPGSEAPLRVLRRLRGLRRDPLCQAGYPAVRRSHDRSPTPRAAPPSTAAPPPPAPTPPTKKAMVPPGPTACSRTTPSSASVCSLAITQRRDKLADTVRALIAVDWCQHAIKEAGQEWLDNMDDGRRLQGSRQEAAGGLQGRHRPHRHRTTKPSGSRTARSATAKPARWPARSSRTPIC